MATASVRVTFPPAKRARGYEVLVREGIIGELAAGELPLPDAASHYIITDSNVAKLYGEKLTRGLSRLGLKVGLVAFPAGEASKTLETVMLIASRLSRLGADRGSVVIALGGGVVGDLAGFVSSVFKRGIGYVQVPTTLLAQVDSSIGGKTGVDTPWGKNQLGTFHQPEKVLTDPLALKTLPAHEMLNGLVEIVKCAVVADQEMFGRVQMLPRFESDVPTDIIVRTCRIKAEIVSNDERENGIRSILNYGHTIGHAIEGSSRYTLSHGASVMFGMMAEGWIALRMGILREEDFEMQSELLQRLSRHFTVKPPKLDKKDLYELARGDKKSTYTSVMMSLPAEVGRMYTTEEGSYRIPVSKEAFDESIDYLRGAFP